MGKRIIIKGANFATNGMKENYIEFTVENGGASGTQQGYVYLVRNRNELSAKSAANYYYNWIKSTKSILLYPGDIIAVKDMPTPMGYMCIYGYRQVIEGMYPVYTPASSSQKISNLSPHDYIETSYAPVMIKNTHATDPLYIVLEGRKASGTPDGEKELSPTATPYIEYRIYTDHPERYEEQPEEAQSE